MENNIIKTALNKVSSGHTLDLTTGDGNKVIIIKAGVNKYKITATSTTEKSITKIISYKAVTAILEKLYPGEKDK